MVQVSFFLLVRFWKETRAPRLAPPSVPPPRVDRLGQRYPSREQSIISATKSRVARAQLFQCARIESQKRAAPTLAIVASESLPGLPAVVPAASQQIGFVDQLSKRFSLYPFPKRLVEENQIRSITGSNNTHRSMERSAAQRTSNRDYLKGITLRGLPSCVPTGRGVRLYGPGLVHPYGPGFDAYPTRLSARAVQASLTASAVECVPLLAPEPAAVLSRVSAGVRRLPLSLRAGVGPFCTGWMPPCSSVRIA